MRLLITAAFAAMMTVVTAGHVDPPASIVGQTSTHVVVKGESWRSIGSRFGVDPGVLARDNGLRPGGVLKVGTVLTIDNRHVVPASLVEADIVVNVPQRMVFYKTGERVFGAPIAVGRHDWPTPLADFTVVLKEEDPTWDVPDSIAAEARAKGQRLPAKVPPGPDNPLGRHWLGLSVGSVGIHGTNAPTSVYQARTHGCIRVHPDDIAVLFGLVEVGTTGHIIYEPVLLGEDGSDVFLEVNADIYRRSRTSALEQARALSQMAGMEDRIDWARAAAVAAAREGVARVVTKR